MRTVVLSVVLSIGAVAAASLLAAGSSGSESAVERGRYLVSTMGCADCHTPHRLGPDGPEPDPERHLAGHPSHVPAPSTSATLAEPWAFAGLGTMTAWSGPWGVSFTANLTPDVETGLGSWSEETFRETLRNGRHMGRGRPLLPPMPFQFYRNLTDCDIGAIFAYLRTIPAVRNRVPEPLPPATR